MRLICYWVLNVACLLAKLLLATKYYRFQFKIEFFVQQQGKLKKKIMEKYEKQKRIKEIWKENSSTTKRNRGRPLKKKNNSEFTKHREKKKSLDESKISRDLDHYFGKLSVFVYYIPREGRVLPLKPNRRVKWVWVYYQICPVIWIKKLYCKILSIFGSYYQLHLTSWHFELSL